MATETDPQVLDTLDQLKRQVKVLQERADDLETINAKLMANGLDDMLKGHGFQQFGGGVARIDGTGIQLVPPGPAARIFHILRAFSATPATSFPSGLIEGDVSATQGEIELRGHWSANRYGALRLNGENNGSTATAELTATHENGATATLSVLAGSTGVGTLSFYDGTSTLQVATKGSGSELTIAGGVVTVLTPFHAIDTEADAASDNLDTINGGITGMVLVIRPANSGRTVVVKDGTGNMKLAGDYTMDNIEDSLMLIYDWAGYWIELSRSDNGV